MTQLKEMTFQALEDTYLTIVSKTTIGVSPDVLKDRAEQLHDISIKIMTMEIVHLSELQSAFALEGEKMKEAVKALKEAIKANTDSMQMMQSVDFALQIMDSFFARLL